MKVANQKEIQKLIDEICQEITTVELYFILIKNASDE